MKEFKKYTKNKTLLRLSIEFEFFEDKNREPQLSYYKQMEMELPLSKLFRKKFDDEITILRFISKRHATYPARFIVSSISKNKPIENSISRFNTEKIESIRARRGVISIWREH